MKSENINTIIEQSLMSEVKNRILQEQEGMNQTTNSLKTLPSFSSLTNDINVQESNTGVIIQLNNVNVNNFLQSLNASSFDDAYSIFNKNIIKDLHNIGLGKNSEIDIKAQGVEDTITIIIKIESGSEELGSEQSEYKENTENMGSNEFLTELHKAKDNNEETFTVQGEEYNVEECYKQLEEEEGFSDDEYSDEGGECTECGNKEVYELDQNAEHKKAMQQYNEIINKTNQTMNENKKKKVLKLSESEFHSMINKIVSEAVPGLEAVKTAHKGDKRDADEYLSSVDKKMKAYLSFDGNDNPEFPHPIGKGEKVATENTPEEDEYVEDFRGGGMQDLVYDEKPSPQFVKRLKNALEGDSTTGNAQDAKTANVIPSKVGNKMLDASKRKEKIKKDMPAYEKDPQPTRPVNEEEEKQKSIINEEIQRMKEMSAYNSKTQ
jgi:hypothetical protein